MLKTTRLLLICLAVGAMATSAFAHEVSLVGALDWHKYDLGNAPAGTTAGTTSAQLGYGGGALVDLFLAPMVSIEPGVLYLQQKYKDDGTGDTVKTKEFQIPVVLRYWFTPMFTIGAGGYYSFGTGQLNVSSLPTQIDYANEQTKNDYGLVGSVGLRLPLGSAANLLVDGRYLYGLKDNNQGIYLNNLTMHNREYQALVGVSFGMGSGHSSY